MKVNSNIFSQLSYAENHGQESRGHPNRKSFAGASIILNLPFSVNCVTFILLLVGRLHSLYAVDAQVRACYIYAYRLALPFGRNSQLAHRRNGRNFSCRLALALKDKHSGSLWSQIIEIIITKKFHLGWLFVYFISGKFVLIF
jgi:hypothetical protein